MNLHFEIKQHFRKYDHMWGCVHFLVYFLLISTISWAQQKSTIHNDSIRPFTIANCVNTFNSEKSSKTEVGYQYWFAYKDFLDGRTLKLSVVAPQKATHLPHRHEEDEFFFVLEGTAEFYLDGETAVAGPYTSFYCPSNSEHGIRNVGDVELKYLVIQKYNLN